MQTDERERLAILRSYAVLDTPDDAGLDQITDLARLTFDVPIALISLVDDQRQWFKSRCGLDARETPRDHAFCAHALPLGRGEIFVVEDAASDVRFAGNPLVTGEPHIRFYAGAVMTSPEGAPLGTLCVIDTKLRPPLTPLQADTLRAMARLVMSELDAQRSRRSEEAKQKLLGMAEAMSGVGHWSLDIATNAVTWSDEVYRIHGVDRRSFDPMLDSALDFYDESDRRAVTEHLETALRERSGFNFELKIRRRDGDLRTVIAKAACEIGPLGEVTALSGVFQDITDHAALLRQVSEDRERFRLLTHNASDVIATYLADGTFTFLSPAVTRLIGRSPEDLVGTKTYGLIHPDDRARVAEAFSALVTGHAHSGRVEYRGLRADGSWVWVEAHPCPNFDTEGRLVSFSDVVRDVSARKQLEAELEQARASAEAATQAKSDFLANMSHELRTPLTAVVGFSDLLAQQPLPNPASDYVRRVQNASKALLSAVNDILDFSALEAGQVTIKPRPTDVGAACRDAAEMFSAVAAAKDVGLFVRVEGRAPAALLVDPDRLRQVLLNLIGNAVKFTDTGSVRISLRFAEERLSVSVKDTGPGITPEAASHLFQRFSQIDGSSTRRHSGTGLGLAICKGLVEAMGGDISLESRPGRGSRFTFTVPARTAQMDASSPVAAEVADSTSALAPGLRVLVVDDHAANRHLARVLLAGAQAEVTEAGTGMDALQRLAVEPFDVVLLDLRMPDADGRSVRDRLREVPGPNCAIPVLAYTAEVPSWAELMEAGFDGLVPKPVSPESLLRAVAEATCFMLPLETSANAG